MNAEGIQVFHQGAVISWARSIGIPDQVAINFIRKAGAVVISDSEQRSLREHYDETG